MKMDMDKNALKELMKSAEKVTGQKPKAVSVSVSKLGKVPGMGGYEKSDKEDNENGNEENEKENKDPWEGVKRLLGQIKNNFSQLEEKIEQGYYQDKDKKEE